MVLVHVCIRYRTTQDGVVLRLLPPPSFPVAKRSETGSIADICDGIENCGGRGRVEGGGGGGGVDGRGHRGGCCGSAGCAQRGGGGHGSIVVCCCCCCCLCSVRRVALYTLHLDVNLVYPEEVGLILRGA